MKQKSNLKSLDQFVEEQYGKIGTPKRYNLEKGYDAFRLGFQIQKARLEKGMTQQQFAEKCGTNNPNPPSKEYFIPFPKFSKETGIFYSKN